VNENGTCVWRGGPLDPGFKNEPVGAWILGGGGLLEPTRSETGYVDQGAARLGDKGTVSQLVDMPAYDIAEPLAMDYSWGCPNCSTNPFDSPELLFKTDKRGFANSLRGSFINGVKMSVLHWCLGENAYDGKISIAMIARGLRPSGGFGMNQNLATVDRLAFVPDATCPRPGSIPNGDFDGQSGWTGSGPQAEVANAVGTNGSRGAKLTAKCGDAPSIAGLVSIPSKSVKHPALAFTWRVTSAQIGGVQLGATTIAQLRGTGAFEPASLCIPEWAKGSVHRLSFFLRHLGNCLSNPPDNEMLVDDVKIVDDATCGEAPLFFDPGFEQSTTTTSRWFLNANNGGGFVAVQKNGQAHGGAAHLALSTPTCGTSVTANQIATIPDAAGAAGPAIKFFYKANVAKDSSVQAFGQSLTSAAAWTARTVCLPASKSGLAQSLELGVFAAAKDCDSVASLQVDDIELTSDATCPVD